MANFLKNTCILLAVLPMLSLGGCSQLQNYGGSIWSKSKLFSGKAGRAVTAFLRPAPKQVEQFIHASAAMPNNADTLIDDFVRQYEFSANTNNANIVPVQTAMIETHYGILPPRLSALTPPHGIAGEIPVDIPSQASPLLAVPMATLPITALEKPALPIIFETEASTPFIAAISPQKAEEAVAMAPTPAKAPQPKKQSAKTKPIIINVPTLGEDDFLAGAPVSPVKIAYMSLKGKSDILDLDACTNTAGTMFIKNFEGYKINPDFTSCMTDKGYVSIRKM